jgi:hypothetical protein
MTAARQQRKPLIVVAGLALSVLASLPALCAALTERVVVDWHTGLAISGFDPVAYFTDRHPTLGTEGYELRYASVVWRFRNAGNRDAFAERPDVYMPQFGGYDPVSAARGVAVAGNPLLWLIVGDRLYLFYNPAARASFDDDPGRVLSAAGRKWPAIREMLTP